MDHSQFKALPKPYSSIIEEFGHHITWEILGTETGWYVWASNNQDADYGFRFSARGDTLSEAMVNISEELWTFGPEWIRA